MERVRLKPKVEAPKRKYLGPVDQEREERLRKRIQELFEGGRIDASGIPEYLCRRLWDK